MYDSDKEIYRVVVVVGQSLVLTASVTSTFAADWDPPQMYRRMRHVGNGPNDNGLVRKNPLTSTPEKGIQESIPLRLIRGLYSLLIKIIIQGISEVL